MQVTPKAEYQFQAVAREDKGTIGGVDWNKSPLTDFKTSTHNTNIVVEVAPTIPPSKGKMKTTIECHQKFWLSM